jgi:phytoene synthase
MSQGAASTSAEDAAALLECERITKASGSSFYLAFLPMPKPRREGIFCVYAFCRVIDDVVDEPAPGMDSQAELHRWRERVVAVARGLPLPDDHPVARGLAITHARFRLHEEDLLAVIDGVEMDLHARRRRDDADLALYCERVAGRVGCLCLPVFGSGDHARPFALDLGHAFQLTNILRDVAHDAREGRIYLPSESLAAFGVSESDVLQGRLTPRLRELMRHVGDRAALLFHRAESAVRSDERAILYPALIMAAIYRRLLDELRARDYDVWSAPVKLPASIKATVALGTLARDKVLKLW